MGSDVLSRRKHMTVLVFFLVVSSFFYFRSCVSFVFKKAFNPQKNVNNKRGSNFIFIVRQTKNKKINERSSGS